MSGFGHETLVKVFKQFVMHKKYQKPYIVLVFAIFGIAMILMFSGDSAKAWWQDEIKSIGFVLLLIDVVLIYGMILFGHRLGLGTMFYMKTVVTNKWEYDEFMRTKSKKEDWKR